MLKVDDIMTSFITDLEAYDIPKYDDYPDLDLYMEQMITVLERNFSIFRTSSLDKQITSSMVNNYVKGNIVTAPSGKKYSKMQISELVETHLLKNVLSINEIKQVFDMLNHNDTSSYDDFRDIYLNKKKEACQDAKKLLKNVEDNNQEKLTEVALELATAANAYLTLARRLLFLLKKNMDYEEMNNKE